VEDLVAVFGQLDAVGFPAGMIEKTNLDLGGVGGIDGEVDAFAVPGRAARIGQALAHSGGKLQIGSIHGRTDNRVQAACRGAGRDAPIGSSGR
jgi:hypothetical protein